MSTTVLDSPSGSPIRFGYKARTASGEYIKGFAKASSEEQVINELYSLGHTVLKVYPTNRGINREFDFTLRKTPKVKALAIMTRQMAAGLDSGMPIVPTLDMLVEQTTDKILREALRAVSNDVEGGSNIADALDRHPLVFPPVMINMVRAGEAGGFLTTSMNRIADNLEFEAKLRSQIRGALVYPIIVFAMSIIAAAVMVFKVVPAFASMYQSIGAKKLPWVTQLLVNLSHDANIVIPVTFVVVIIGSSVWRKYRNTERVRRVVDPLKFKLPGIGGMFHKVALARFCRNLSLLLESGVPVLGALEMTASTIGNIRMAAAIRRAEDAVRQGRSITDPLREEPLFPPMVIQMMNVGDKSGKVGYMLQKASVFYDQEVETATKSMESLVQPIMLLVVGTIVAFIAIAIYYPYFNMGSLINNG